MGAYDVIVVGGGSAGCIAAIQAARAGAKTALVEKNGILGGTITVGAVNFPGLFHAWGQQIIDGIGWEVIMETVRLGGAILPDFSTIPEKHWHQQIRVNRFVYAAVLDEFCLQAGVELRLHEIPVSIAEQDNKLLVSVAGKGGMQVLQARKVIDATGDADLCGMLGYAREKSEKLQPGTLINEIDGYEFSCINPDELQCVYDEALAEGSIRVTDHPASSPPFYNDLRSGVISMHIPGIDGSSSQSKTEAEIKARQTLLRIYRFLRRVPGCEQLSVRYAANECGIRETWRIIGEARIDEASYVSGFHWPDAICYSFYPIDLHHPSDNTVIKHYLDKGVVATIPYRALIPINSDHLLVAGRCISGDQMANSAYRVQATCMATGQCAGAAAAIAAKLDVSLREVPLAALKAMLLEHSAIVP
ncbi:FAD-dependent oxidoreductase [Paenibacillus sp. FSL H7-0331]|uniref:FAD-dependent oxidoreductase n=1 Tax=Paenibacillus sp. FSL H7-0331 TaxID=1920421 RepID=UPI00096C5216|nr:FAD-dependent oxidoreductase [Paenibacillus sp. FSL H7-0331]OMF04336.1 hypothetical protein BK127_34330 [Paenibacillus sp. FSL H7-0331]